MAFSFQTTEEFADMIAQTVKQCRMRPNILQFVLCLYEKAKEQQGRKLNCVDALLKFGQWCLHFYKSIVYSVPWSSSHASQYV